MTPLLRTKTPSAPVGDKSGGERRAARAAAFLVFTNHETRDTKYDFFRRGCTRDAQSETAAWTAVHAARSLLSCALWRGMGRLWRGMGGMGDPSRCFPVHDCSALFSKKYYA